MLAWVLGVIMEMIIVGIFYTRISKYYISQEYILMEINNGKNKRVAKIKGDCIDITCDNECVQIQRDKSGNWNYKNKKIICNEKFKVGNKEFEIIAKENKGGFPVLIPLSLTAFTFFLLLAQSFFMSNYNKKNTVENYDREYIHGNDENLPTTIKKEERVEEKVEIYKPKSEERVFDFDKDIHTIVLEYDNIFQENISIDWEMFQSSDNKRRTLKNNPSELGINVSKYQETIDWKRVKDDGIDFAIIRVGSRGYETGNLNIDPNFEINMDGAITNDIKVGVFFYSQAINKKEMDEEIDVILNAVKKYKLDYPIGIILEQQEEYRTVNLSQEEYIDLIKYFCIRMKVSGYSSMIYDEIDWLQQFPEGTFDGYLKWVYNANVAPSDINNCIIWQYIKNSRGMVDGIDDDLVLSINLSAYLDLNDDN